MGSFNSLAAGGCAGWEDKAQCMLELNKLQLAQARLMGTGDPAGGALLSAMQERRLLYERKVLLSCMEAMPRRQLQGLLQEWGISLSSSNKKEQLLSLLWQLQTPAAAVMSAATCRAVLAAACEPRVLALLMDMGRPGVLDTGVSGSEAVV
jgi:hypothetical protein